MTVIHKEIEQLSPEWFELKLGKISGSQMKNIVQPTTGKLKAGYMQAIYKVVAEKLTGMAEETYINAAMQHGIDWEDEGKEKFIEHVQTPGWQNVGFVTVGWLENAGLSPDYICGDDPVEAMELKCPTSKKHIEIWHTKKVPNEWLPQCLSYFVFLENLKTLHFCSYDFRVKKYPLVHITMKREDFKEQINNLTDSLIKVDEIINEILK
jgi:hypothetical protein